MYAIRSYYASTSSLESIVSIDSLTRSGSIALGRGVLGLPRGSLPLEQSQAAAAVGQIRLARAYEVV